MSSTATVLFHHAVADRLGLNPTDHKCADLIMRHGPLTAGELADVTGLTSGAITGVVDRLEKAGYVKRERDEHDRRKVMIHAQHDPEIERTFMALFASISSAMEKLCDEYSEQDLEMVLDFMGRCRKLAEEETRRLRTLDISQTIPEEHSAAIKRHVEANRKAAAADRERRSIGTKERNEDRRTRGE